MFKKINEKITSFLDKRFTKRQQTLGVFSVLLVALIVCMVIIFTSDMSTDNETEQVGESPEAVEGIKPEDVPIEEMYQAEPTEETGAIGTEEETEESAENFTKKIDDATPIEVKEIEETKAVLIDSSENYVLFIGYAGVLSVYDKNLKTFRQIDNPVTSASISDDERFVAYTREGETSSEVLVYILDYPQVEEGVRKEGRLVKDVKMHNGMIVFTHYEKGKEDYTLETFVHLSEREGKTSKEILPLVIEHVGPYLYMDDEHIYFMDKKSKTIKAIYPGLHEPEVAKIKSDEADEFILLGKDVYYLENEVLKRNDKTVKEADGVRNFNRDKNKIYVVIAGTLFTVENDKLSLLADSVSRVSPNSIDLVFQEVGYKTYIKK